jgi:hypothetical protein
MAVLAPEREGANAPRTSLRLGQRQRSAAGACTDKQGNARLHAYAYHKKGELWGGPGRCVVFLIVVEQSVKIAPSVS